MDPATIAALTMAASAGAGYFGQTSANSANSKIANKQMAFQERMSSTAYQRARADMEAAGINPIVAFSSGAPGASTPAGSSAQMQSPTAAGVSSALQARRLEADVANVRSQTELNEATKRVAEQQAKLVNVNAQSAAYELPGKAIEAQIDSSAGGYIYRMLDRVVKSLSPFKFGK